MRNTLFLIPLALSLSVSSVTSARAADSEPDGRLAQKVTIECSEVRLHTAIEQISAKTKVTISTGSSGLDWKTRDVPILVCAQDITLAGLLKAIIDANHLQFSKTKDDHDVISYRLWRDRKWQDQIDAYKAAKKAAEIGRVDYDWDAMTKIKDLPESEFEDRQAAMNTEHPEVGRAWAKTTRALSNLVAQLGPEVKDEVMSNGALFLNVDTAPDAMKPYVKDALTSYLAAWNANPPPGSSSATESTEQRLNRCYLQVSFGGDGVSDELCVTASDDGTKFCLDGGGAYWYLAGVAKKKVDRRPEIPKPDFDTDKLGEPYVELKPSESGGPDLLDKKVKIEAPKGKKNPTYMDLLCGLSQKIGYSVVAEGSAARYIGRVITRSEKFPGMFGREITVREVLEFAQDINYERWYLNERDKVIIGRDRDWIMRLDALVPEKLILDLQKKLNGAGMGLDDLEPLAGLSNEQVAEWINACPETPELSVLRGTAANDGLLHLYFSLSPEQRAWVQSGKPLALGDLDQNYIGPYLRKCAVRLLQRGFNPYLIAGYAKNMSALKSSDTIAGLSLRLETTALKDGKQACKFLVEGPDGSGVSMVESVRQALPIKAPPKAKEE